MKRRIIIPLVAGTLLASVATIFFHTDIMAYIDDVSAGVDEKYIAESAPVDERDIPQKIADNWAESIRLVNQETERAQSELDELVDALISKCEAENLQVRAERAMKTMQFIDVEDESVDCDDVETLLDTMLK